MIMQRWGRIVILAAMLVTAYLLILAWNKDHPAVTQVSTAPTSSVASTAMDLPPAGATSAAPSANDLPPVSSDVPVAPVVSPTVAASQGLISVQTDVYRLWINPRGGDVVRSELLQHDG
jgi:YidC/Oxa1 family membrane protein insertase